MSYAIYHEGGYIGAFASIGGASDLVQLVESVMPDSSIAAFLAAGETTDIVGVREDINKLLGFPMIDSVRSTLVALRWAMARAEEIAIISES